MIYDWESQLFAGKFVPEVRANSNDIRLAAKLFRLP